MISPVSNSFMNNRQVNFRSAASQPRQISDYELTRLDVKMSNALGCGLDDFIRICDDRKFYLDHGMSKQDYYNSDEYADQIASI